MAIVLKEVQALEKQKEDLRNKGVEILQNEDLTQQQKNNEIGNITDLIFEIDQEIKRLKKIAPTEAINPMFLIIGLGAILFLIRKK